MVFFYEAIFVVVAMAAVLIGEAWSRSIALVLLVGSFAMVTLALASFQARLATAEASADQERRWMTDARDGLRHLRLLFGLACVAALVWRLVAG